MTASTVVELGRRLRPGTAPVLQPADVPRAAVAIVLREVAVAGGGLEFLLIKRAERDDDPWSGQIALPGGRADPADISLEATAVRETMEETGIDLARDGTVLGALPDLSPRTTPLPVVVRPFVATVRGDVRLVLSDEVATAFWVPLASLTAAGAIVESEVRVRNATLQVPSFRHGEHVVWGMTQRILYELLQLLDEPRVPGVP
jgi:8-oxo-dGTP pyrophosphatase MutT (NUDIX family)